MAEAQIPEGLDADYENSLIRERMLALQTTPDYAHLAGFLNALREGFLVADVTGTAKKKATHIRTIRSTNGQLVLPLFTSMAELRAALPKGQVDQAKGAFMPSLEALRLIRTKPFVAVQLDAGSAAFAVVRKYINLVLGDEPIDAASLEAAR